MPNYKIIINPTSGRGSAGKLAPSIEEMLRQRGLQFDVEFTERPWHAAELARRACEDGYDVVVAVGGDGTANEAINGLMAARNAGQKLAALGVLPVGRGNDFAASMGVPAGLPESIAALVDDQRRAVDIGHVRGGLYPAGRYFGNGVGIGFDAVVGFEALKLAPLSGFASYLVAALKTIFLYFHAPMVNIELDGQSFEQRSLMVSVMNGRRLGGGFWMAPHGAGNDGLFDLCIAGQVSRVGIFGLIPRFMKGTQALHPAIKMMRARKVKVTARDGALPAHSDGETLCTDGRELEVELLPLQIELVVHPNGHLP